MNFLNWTSNKKDQTINEKEITIIEVKDILNEYQDIINIIKSDYKYRNYNFYQNLLSKLEQNKQNIHSKFQSNIKEINEYKNIVEKAKAEKILINQLQQTNKKNEENIAKYKNALLRLKNNES